MEASTKLYLALFAQFIVTISLAGILLYMLTKQKQDIKEELVNGE